MLSKKIYRHINVSTGKCQDASLDTGAQKSVTSYKQAHACRCEQNIRIKFTKSDNVFQFGDGSNWTLENWMSIYPHQSVYSYNIISLSYDHMCQRLLLCTSSDAKNWFPTSHTISSNGTVTIGTWTFRESMDMFSWLAIPRPSTWTKAPFENSTDTSMTSQTKTSKPYQAIKCSRR